MANFFSRVSGRLEFAFGLILALSVHQISCFGSFELYISSFTNDESIDSNENCCSGERHSSQCSSNCNTFFLICLSHYQSNIPENPSCTYGKHTTPIIGNSSYTFPPVSQGASQNVISFPFSFSWPGTFTLIIQAWHNNVSNDTAFDNPDISKSLIARNAIQKSVLPSDGWIEEIYSSNSFTMTYKYRVACALNQYGPGCSVKCIPRDDKLGHYECNQQGIKMCLNGWTGQYCDTAVCLPGCHATHGSCTEPNECKCNIGYQGPMCDKCIVYPGCKHGMCEIPWQCNCEQGWGGLFCNQDLNFCTNHKPCRNGATCTNTGQGSYTCTCREGFFGTNCEQELNDCRPSNKSCLNRGNCLNVPGTDRYECQCPTGLQGRRCELRVGATCREAPCRNGGTCNIPAQGSGGKLFQCSCRPGYTGVNCEAEMNECISQPCLNDGRCINEQAKYRCVCPAGFSGERCEENSNDCAVNPCLNGGICLDKINDFECRCQPGFVGPLCQENVDDCLLYPCANGAVCKDLVNSVNCTCAPGFTGKLCEVKLDTCAGHPCLNGGTCVDGVGSYNCKCEIGYHGENCEFLTVMPYFVVDEASTTSKSQTVAEFTFQQLLLIVCLGVGIPVVIMFVVVVFLVVRRRRTRRRDEAPDEKDNEENQRKALNNKNNKNACLELNVQNIPEADRLFLKLGKLSGDDGELEHLHRHHRNHQQQKNKSNINRTADVHKIYTRKQNNLSQYRENEFLRI